MRSQQEAEREEQQRIKNLVLNYDLREDNEQHDGTSDGFSYGPIVQRPLDRNRSTKGFKIGPNHYNIPLTRAEKSGRHAPRARRLNLSDVDWYGTEQKSSQSPKW